MFDRHMSASLDAHITGHYGEDQFRGEDAWYDFMESVCSKCFMRTLNQCPLTDEVEEMSKCLVMTDAINKMNERTAAENEAEYQDFLRMEDELFRSGF